jgi:hypothetical protein
MIKNAKQYKYIVIFTLPFLVFGTFYFHTISSEEETFSEKINPIYFYSLTYEDQNGLYATQCPQTKGIDWQLAVYTLSAYMEFEVKNEDFGPAEIQRNFDENCERNMNIYNTLSSKIKSN